MVLIRSRLTTLVMFLTMLSPPSMSVVFPTILLMAPFLCVFLSVADATQVMVLGQPSPSFPPTCCLVITLSESSTNPLTLPGAKRTANDPHSQLGLVLLKVTYTLLG